MRIEVTMVEVVVFAKNMKTYKFSNLRKAGGKVKHLKAVGNYAGIAAFTYNKWVPVKRR